MKQPVISLTREECLELHSSLRREWLETDGRGGFASSTVLMCPTRRYHGLLVAALPGLGRHSFLSRFEESVHGSEADFREREFPLSIGRYPAVWHPHGHQGIQGFELVPWPRARYLIGRVAISREILMQRGAPVVLSRYVAEHPHDELRLRLRPILTYRAADALTVENLAVDPRVERVVAGVSVRPYGALPALSLTVGGVEPTFEVDPVWYRRLEYQRDLARGYDGHEDLFSPGWFDLPLPSGQEIVVAATIGEPVAEPIALWQQETKARRRAAQACPDGPRGLLEVTVDDFLYRDPENRLGVIAGFPWFGEWGRDSYISLPGLLLATGRVREGGEALEGVLPYLDNGRLPNIFASSPSESAYNSIDAALWFARAVELWHEAGGGPEKRRSKLLAALEQIATAYLENRVSGITLDDGLIRTAPGTGALTWMDANVDGEAVTPRSGCAVEINALWFALLRFLERSYRTAGNETVARAWGRRRRQAGESFLARLWLGDEGYLADTWLDGEADRSVRPNMVIAAALESSPLSRDQRLGVIERTEAELLTPVGLRTLSPKNRDYQGRYSGGPETRDRAYHQGTVWPWLTGFYVEACLRGRGRRAAEKRRLAEMLTGFAEQSTRHGLLHVSEVFDGDPPHRPGGCIAQAWSTAELLRGWSLLDRKAR